MAVAYLTVTMLAAAANIYAATNDFRRLEWVVGNMNRLGVPQRWLATLGVLKAAGAVGLLAGIQVPMIGVAAAAGLVLFFVGAIVTAARAHWYSHLPYPVVWLALAAGSLILRLASLPT
jgi:DoxX-like family